MSGGASMAPSTSSTLALLLSVESIPESIFWQVSTSVIQLMHKNDAPLIT